MGSLLPPPRRLTRVWALVIGVPFFGALALLTLTPARIEYAMPNLLDVMLAVIHRLGWTSLDFHRFEIIANVLVFVPVGVLAFMLLPRRAWPLTLLVGPVLSLAIEGAQRIALPHRAATVTDVLANSVGATAGLVLAVLCTLVFAPRRSSDPSPTLEAS